MAHQFRRLALHRTYAGKLARCGPVIIKQNWLRGPLRSPHCLDYTGTIRACGQGRIIKAAFDTWIVIDMFCLDLTVHRRMHMNS